MSEPVDRRQFLGIAAATGYSTALASKAVRG